MTELLERLGHTVEFPQGQTCCGQMHFNTGYRPETLPWCAVSRRSSRVATPWSRQAGRSREPARRAGSRSVTVRRIGSRWAAACRGRRT
ncbi:heterodisulfide reductase-related iron-sulfur binding cluster [Streptomyces sp. NY05-11A]|uniref:heterodisulfide reductase-related iron-sulfur binding cluster n=1 Tax=Streptomyces soliscabiei TaxID=588897 RepID=UPI0039F71139